MSAVEFLDDAGADLPVDQGLSGGSGVPPWLAWIAGGMLLTLVLGVAASKGSGDRTPVAVASSSTVASRVLPPDDHRFDQPQVTSDDLSACPDGVLCSRLDHVPDLVVSAVRRRIPRVTLGPVLNVEFVRKGDFGLALWYRRMEFRTDRLLVEVVVQQETADAADDVADYTLGEVQVRRVERVLPGRVVIIRVESSGALPSTATLQALAADLRLVAL